jgi:hypothetical protein
MKTRRRMREEKEYEKGVEDDKMKLSSLMAYLEPG